MTSLASKFPVEVNNLHRLEITPADSVEMLRLKVPEYKEESPERVLHVINRYLHGHSGQHGTDKGLTILTPGTYIVDIADHLDWEAGEFGDQHSCYWAGYTNERRRMSHEGTWALRVHLSPKHRSYVADPEMLEANIAALYHWYQNPMGAQVHRMTGEGPHVPLPYDAGRDGSRAFFVPWWRLAEAPGIERSDNENAGVYQYDDRGRILDNWHNRQQPREQVKIGKNDPGWQQVFGDRWPGDRRTAIMHNPYGSLHLPQLAGLYAKLTGLYPNHIDRGIANFGDAKPYEYDWVFDRRYYLQYARRAHYRNLCDNCHTSISFKASRPIQIQHLDHDGQRVGPANRNGYWCIECIVQRARKSPKTERWTRTRGVKWEA